MRTLATADVVWSLAIAGVALVISLVSLGVTIEMWRRSGPRVSVSFQTGFPIYGGMPGETHLGIEAKNSGRVATTVSGWGFLIDGSDKTIFDQVPAAWLPRLPYRLEPHTSATWMMAAALLRETVHGGDLVGRKVRPFVRLETGERLATKRAVDQSFLK